MALRPATARGTPDRPGSLLALALWAGIVTGCAEVAAVAGKLVGPDFSHRSPDALWMTPAFDAVLFALLGGVLAAVGRLVRIPWRVAAGGFAGMGVLLVLLLFPSLHRLAGLVLAAGVGIQVARALSNREPRAARVVQRSLACLAGGVCVLAVLMVSWRAVREHWLVHSRPAAQQGAPNVLLLILDTVRAADLSLYGYARRTTPELERFAERGTVFELAFAPSSWTTPSHASIFTGRWALELDVTTRHGLSLRWPTLAEALRARGYATAGFVANADYAGWESGLSRGFEHYDDYPLTLWTASAGTAFGIAVYPSLHRPLSRVLYRLPLLWRLRLPQPHRNASAEEIADGLLRWLDRARPAPFFAFLNFMDAHPPYTPPDSFRYRYRSRILRPVSPEASAAVPSVRLTPADLRPKQDVYDGSIAYLDSLLGRLFRELERRRLLDNTLVIITADHGDEFAEHGLVGHGLSLYRLSLQVPLLVWLPARVPPGLRVAAPVSLRNLASTVLDFVPPGPQLPGRSLARFWTGADTTPDTIVASANQTENLPLWLPVSRGDLNSIALNGLRYIRNEGDGTEELYDLEHDVLERWNLVGSAEGTGLLREHRAALGALVSSASEPDVADR